MARRYNPQTPFDVAMKLLKPTSTMSKGVTKKVFPDPKDVINSNSWMGYPGLF